MCNKAVLRDLVTQRLNAAAEDIFELFERSIAEFERELLLRIQNHNNPQQQAPSPEPSKETNTDVPVSSDSVKVEPEEWLLDPTFTSVQVKTEDKDDHFPLQNPTQTEECIEETFEFEDEGAPLSPLNSDRDEHGDGAGAEPEHSMIIPDSIPSSSLSHISFSCVEWGKTFKKKESIVKHMRKHTGEKKFMCSVCCKFFSEKASLKQHKRLLHNLKVIESFKCSVCMDTFPSKKMRNRHMKSSHMKKRPFVCTFCNKNFTTENRLTLHMKAYCEIRPFPCPACEKSFVEQMDLTQHLKQIHHVCPVCSKGFSDKLRLRSHMSDHSETQLQETFAPFGCSTCGKRFSRETALKKHILVHTDEATYKCTICEKSFKCKIRFSKHMEQHRLQCVQCGFKADKIRTLEMHMFCSHMVCPVCKERFTDRDVLIDHTKAHHSGVCTECGVDLKNTSLSLHRSRAHLICSVCEEHFTDKTSLKGHLNIHINNGTLDPSSGQIIHCEECGDLFFHKSELWRHECDRTLTGHQ